MAIITMPVVAREGSTYGVKIEFIEVRSDQLEPMPVTPNSGLTWSWASVEDGSIVNERNAVELTADSTVYIALYGEDLALPGGYPVERALTIVGTYDSVLLGNGLPFVIELHIQVENLVGQPPQPEEGG